MKLPPFPEQGWSTADEVLNSPKGNGVPMTLDPISRIPEKGALYWIGRSEKSLELSHKRKKHKLEDKISLSILTTTDHVTLHFSKPLLTLLWFGDSSACFIYFTESSWPWDKDFKNNIKIFPNARQIKGHILPWRLWILASPSSTLTNFWQDPHQDVTMRLQAFILGTANHVYL